MRRTLPLVALAATLALAGCTSKDPGPDLPPSDQPTATTTPTKEVDPRRAAERAAIQRLKDYHTASNQLGHGGYDPDDISTMTSFTAGDYSKTFFDQVAWLSSQGAVLVGASVQTDYKVVDHHAVTSDFYDDQLTIEVCNDTTNVDIVLSDGSSVMSSKGKGRFIATVTMWHSIDQDMWRIAQYITDGGRPC